MKVRAARIVLLLLWAPFSLAGPLTTELHGKVAERLHEESHGKAASGNMTINTEGPDRRYEGMLQALLFMFLAIPTFFCLLKALAKICDICCGCREGNEELYPKRHEAED